MSRNKVVYGLMTFFMSDVSSVTRSTNRTPKNKSEVLLVYSIYNNMGEMSIPLTSSVSSQEKGYIVTSITVRSKTVADWVI